MVRFGYRLAVASALVSWAACGDVPTRTTTVGDIPGQLSVDAKGTVSGPQRAPGVPSSVSLDVLGTADGVVLPAALALTMGNGNNVYPLSYGPMRYQQVFLGTEVGSPRSIGGLCFRQDDVWPSVELRPHIVLKLGPTAADTTTLGLTFDQNYAAAPTTVFDGIAILPAGAAGTPSSWTACIPFQAAYAFTGGNLLMEVVNDSPRPPAFWVADFCEWSASCTTTRVYAYDPGATGAAWRDRHAGLVVRLQPASPQLQASTLLASIADLNAAGSIKAGQAKALSLTLARVAERIENGDYPAAVRQLDVFTYQLSGLAVGNQIGQPDAQRLLDAAGLLKNTLVGV